MCIVIEHPVDVMFYLTKPLSVLMVAYGFFSRSDSEMPANNSGHFVFLKPGWAEADDTFTFG